MTVYITCTRFQALVFKIARLLHRATTVASVCLQTILSIKQRSCLFVNVRMGTPGHFVKQVRKYQ